MASDNSKSGVAPEGDSTAVLFIKTLFGETTEHPVFVCSLPNTSGDPNEPGPRQTLTRDGDKLATFAQRWDRRGRGLFFCTGTVTAGQRRAKDTILETIGLWSDIDFKGVDADEPLIRQRLRELRCQPSALVRSGHGLHVYWLFKEGLESQPNQERIEAALRQLADLVAGDLAVAEISRLMRLPGSHNTKGGEWREVVYEFVDGPRYELEELEEWLSETAPILQRKAVGENGATAQRSEDMPPAAVPFLEAAREQGYTPPIDVETRLADMAPGNIHNTIRDVSASLIARGQPPDEVAAVLEEAVGRLKDQDPEWRGRRREIRAAIKGAIPKFAPAEAAAMQGPQDPIINLGAERAARAKLKPRAVPKDLLVAFSVVEGVIATLRQDNQDIMLSEGEVWLYGNGFWRIMTPADEQWLRTLIQTGFEILKEPARNAPLSLAWRRLIEHPQLFMAKVPWVDADMVVCVNGVLRFGETLTFEPHVPANYARRHIGAAYDPDAHCPRFERLLESMFADRVDAPEAIALLQEWLGAALAISCLSREERRAMILVGPSRTGKTELARIFARLLGDPIAAPSVAELSERFGLEGLCGATAWIRDDAINEGDKLDPQRFKTVVTGERVDIERKHRLALPGISLNLPVLLTVNTLPRARDGSDAIFNRSIVLTMTNVVNEADAVAGRLEAGISIGLSIFDREAAGILNWALAGLRRLRIRGRYEIPDSVGAAIRQFKDDNNPVGEWAREAVEVNPNYRVERRDLVRAYNGWELELEGDEARAHGGRWLLPRLRSQLRGLGDTQLHDGRRYITGLRLTDVGLAMWEAYGMANPRHGPGGSATNKGEVNQVHFKGGHNGRNSLDDPPF